MNNDQTKDPIDLRNVPAANTNGKPVPDTKVPANNKAKDTTKTEPQGVLRDLRDN